MKTLHQFLEETFQLAEVSDKLLKRYVRKATLNQQNHFAKGQREKNQNGEAATKHYDKWEKRNLGIDKAEYRLKA